PLGILVDGCHHSELWSDNEDDTSNPLLSSKSSYCSYGMTFRPMHAMACKSIPLTSHSEVTRGSYWEGPCNLAPWLDDEEDFLSKLPCRGGSLVHSDCSTAAPSTFSIVQIYFISHLTFKSINNLTQFCIKRFRSSNKPLGETEVENEVPYLYFSLPEEDVQRRK
ncbi:hypothetical protein AVEN_64023-1, partial [Araneus ventricosus]